MAKDNYYIKARLFPTVITSLPILFLVNNIVATQYHSHLIGLISPLPFVTYSVFSLAIVFFLVQINRFIAKEIFQRIYFQDEISMPTTNLLLKSNTDLEISIKQKLEEKIKVRFGIELLNLEDESTDEIRARKLIVTAVSQIRNVLRGNSMLLSHNIEYGFIRNLLGGSLFAFFVSIIIIVIFHFSENTLNRNIGFFLMFVYLLPVAFSKLIINRYGKYYAKVLFEHFLTF